MTTELESRSQTKQVSTHSEILAVYGTLRKGQNFFEHLDDPIIVKTIQLNRYLMFDLGACPVIIDSSNPSHTIVVDVLKVTPKDFERISRIESAAGYILSLTHKQKDIHNNGLQIWVAKTRANIVDSDYPVIRSGDWVKFISDPSNARARLRIW